jgi:membrane protein
MQKYVKELWRFLLFVVDRFFADRCMQMASSLTFTTLLSLVPLITIALTVFSAFPVFADYSAQIKIFLLSNMMPETGGRLITGYMEQFAESAGKLTAVGIVLLGVTAMLLMQTIDNALNTIWRVTRPRTLVLRILTYWAMLTLAPLLVGISLSLTSWLLGMSAGYAKQIPVVEVLMLKLVSLLLTTLAFSLLFRVVPNRFVPMKHALIGGLVSALAFGLMGKGFGFYISHFPTYKLVYGAFASVPIFLMWIYLSWLTILSGALIASSLPHWRGVKERVRGPAAQLYYALCILRAMGEGMHSGTALTVPALSRKLHVDFELLEQLLDRLSEANMVSKLADEGWGLIRDLEHVRLDELRRLFIFDPQMVAVQGDDGGIGEWLLRMGRRNEEAEKITLNELFAEAAGLREGAPE